jgi:hypothetical protein
MCAAGDRIFPPKIVGTTENVKMPGNQVGDRVIAFSLQTGEVSLATVRQLVSEAKSPARTVAALKKLFANTGAITTGTGTDISTAGRFALTINLAAGSKKSAKDCPGALLILASDDAVEILFVAPDHTGTNPVATAYVVGCSKDRSASKAAFTQMSSVLFGVPKATATMTLIRSPADTREYALASTLETVELSRPIETNLTDSSFRAEIDSNADAEKQRRSAEKSRVTTGTTSRAAQGQE